MKTMVRDELCGHLIGAFSGGKGGMAPWKQWLWKRLQDHDVSDAQEGVEETVPEEGTGSSDRDIMGWGPVCLSSELWRDSQWKRCGF